MTQKDNMFEDLAPEEPSNGTSNGSANGNGNGHTPQSDTGPTGPFTALSSSELAAVTVDEDEDADLEDLSEDLEVAEDSVRTRMPVAPLSAVPATEAAPADSLAAEAADLDWSVEEAATRAVGGAEAFESEQPPAQSVTSHGMPAPRLEGAFMAPPAATPPADDSMSLEQFVSAPTVGLPSTAPPPPPPAPVVSPFVLIADVDAPAPSAAPPPFPAQQAQPVQPVQPVQPWGTPVQPSSPAVLPFQHHDALPIVEEPLPSTRAMPEMVAAVTPVAPIADDFPLPAPRKSSSGTIVGILAGVLIAGMVAAGVWWFQLREKTGTLVLRAPENAMVIVDGAPAAGVSGLFIVRDLGVGTHSVLVNRPGAAPWVNAVQITAGDSLQIEAPGARGGDTGAAGNVAQPPSTVGSAVAPLAAQPGTATAPTSVEPATPAAEQGTSSTTPATTTPRTTPSSGTGTTQPTPRSTPSEPAARGTGTLSVNTVPWAAVEVDGRSVGNTPVLRHELRAGDHRVTLIVQAWNIRQTRRVQIRAGENSTVTVRFQEPGSNAPPRQPGQMGPAPNGPPRQMGPGPNGPPRQMGPGPGPGPGQMGPRPMGPGPGPGPMGPPPRN